MYFSSKYIKIIAFLLIFPTIVFSQRKVELILESDSIEMGDQTKLFLLADKNAGKISFPIFGDTLIGNIEIIESNLDTTKDGKWLRMNYLITSFDPAIYPIPPIPILIGNDTVFTNRAYLYVTPFVPDSSLLSELDTANAPVIFNMKLPHFDIKEPIDTPFNFDEFWLRFSLYVWLALLIIVIAVVLYFYIKKRNKKTTEIVKKAKPKIPAHITAVKELNALKNRKLWQKEETKAYYTQLTEIIRIYIEQRFEVPALEQTSHELLRDMKAIKILQINELELLKKMLKLADLVKFAKYKPLANDNDLHLKNAYLFVENTKIRDQRNETSAETAKITENE